MSDGDGAASKPAPPSAPAVPARDPDRQVAKLVVPGEQGSTRRFVATVLVLVLLALATVMAAGVVLNPRGEFPTRFHRPLTWQAVPVKADLYDAHAPPEVLILGSSRATAVPGDPWANGTTWFNFAIPSSTFTDFEILWDHVLSGGAAPAHVVILLDSFALLDPADGYPSAIRGSSHAWRYTSTEMEYGPLAQKALQALSMPYLRDDLRVLKFTYVTSYPNVYGARFDADGMQVTNTDGSGGNARPADLEAAVERHWDQAVSRFWVEPLRPRETQEDLLTSLVQRIRATGATVDLVLTPFHRFLLERLEGNTVFEEFQRAELALALRQCGDGVRVFDYGRTEAFGGDPDGFLDGFHMTLDNSRRLAEAAAAGVGEACGPGPAPTR